MRIAITDAMLEAARRIDEKRAAYDRLGARKPGRSMAGAAVLRAEAELGRLAAEAIRIQRIAEAVWARRAEEATPCAES